VIHRVPRAYMLCAQMPDHRQQQDDPWEKARAAQR
jgi:hypothetical protein